MTEKAIRQQVVSTAGKYLGCNEKDGSHRQIIDCYNSHKPLARGYAMKYTDAYKRQGYRVNAMVSGGTVTVIGSGRARIVATDESGNTETWTVKG